MHNKCIKGYSLEWNAIIIDQAIKEISTIPITDAKMKSYHNAAIVGMYNITSNSDKHIFCG